MKMSRWDMNCSPDDHPYAVTAKPKPTSATRLQQPWEVVPCRVQWIHHPPPHQAAMGPLKYPIRGTTGEEEVSSTYFLRERSRQTSDCEVTVEPGVFRASSTLCTE